MPVRPHCAVDPELNHNCHYDTGGEIPGSRSSIAVRVARAIGETDEHDTWYSEVREFL